MEAINTNMNNISKLDIGKSVEGRLD